MRLIYLTKDIHIQTRSGGTDGDNKKLLKNTGYVMPDMAVNQLVTLYTSSVIDKDLNFEGNYVPYAGQSLDNKSLYCFRAGGIGDLIFMLSGVENIRRKYPTCTIQAGSASTFTGVLNRHPDISKTHILPYEYDDIKDCDYCLYFEEIIEGNPEAEKINAYDLFLERFGFNPEEVETRHKIPTLHVDPAQMAFIDKSFRAIGIERQKDIIVGVHLVTSSPIRDYPIGMVRELIINLAGKGYKVVLIGSNISGANFIKAMGLDSDTPNVINFTSISTDLHKFFSIVSYCDAVISPDSSTPHIAGSMGIPIIGLFGGFESDLRLRYYKNAIGLQGRSRCAPCFKHGEEVCRNNIRGHAACMTLMEPEYVGYIFDTKILPLIKKEVS